MDGLRSKSRGRVCKELNQLVNRNARFLANFAQSGYDGLTHRIGNALVQQLEELRKGRLGTGSQVAQNGRYVLLSERLLQAVEQLTAECFDEGMTYVHGSGGPF